MGQRIGRAGALALTIWLAATATASADELAFSLRLTSSEPGTPTRGILHITFPYGASGKPRPPRHIEVALPDGTRFDEGAVPICSATDQELQAQGSSACSPETSLGGGTATAITGFGPPFDPTLLDVHAFHRRGELVNVYTFQGSDRPGVHLSKSRIVGTAFVEDLSPDPGGPPDGRTNARTLDHQLAPRNLPGRSFVTTPTTCPPSRTWTSRLTIVWDDDGSTQTATSATPCTGRAGPATGAPSPRPRLALALTPARVHRGAAARFRFRVGGTRSCSGRAIVLFGLRRRTVDRAGQASLVARLSRPGRHRVWATARGCRPALATFRVVA
jgi:hypothetical protein